MRTTFLLPGRSKSFKVHLREIPKEAHKYVLSRLFITELMSSPPHLGPEPQPRPIRP